MFGVSRWNVMRRVQEYGISDLQEFSNISDERIDDVIKDYISRHGRTTGEPFMSGYFHSSGLHVNNFLLFSFLLFPLQFKRVASNVCLVARSLIGCGGMEQSVYDDRNERQGKPAKYW